MITIDSRSITKAVNKIREEYSHISGDKLNIAISRALNRAASSGRTEANKNIRNIYNISASRLNNELKTRNSNARNLTAMIIASGSPLSLTNFQAKQIGDRGTTSFDRKGIASSRLTRKTRNKAIKGVSMTIKKGQTVNIPTAFIQTANGGITVFARGMYKGSSEGFEFAKERLPIAKLTSTSIPLMFGNNDVINPTGSRTEQILIDRITHEIDWLLK